MRFYPLEDPFVLFLQHALPLRLFSRWIPCSRLVCFRQIYIRTYTQSCSSDSPSGPIRCPLKNLFIAFVLWTWQITRRVSINNLRSNGWSPRLKLISGCWAGSADLRRISPRAWHPRPIPKTPKYESSTLVASDGEFIESHGFYFIVLLAKPIPKIPFPWAIGATVMKGYLQQEFHSYPCQ